MEKRTPYYNRFDPKLLGELKKLSTKKNIPVADLLDQAISLLLAKYRQPEPVLQPVGNREEKQVVISVSKRRRRRTGHLRLHKGQWYAQVQIGVNEDGKKIRKEIYLGTAAKMTEIEAWTKFDEVVKQIEEQI